MAFYAAILTVDAQTLLPVDTHLSHSVGIVLSIHYPSALVTIWQGHDGFFYRDIRDRSRAKSVDKTWQACWTYKASHQRVPLTSIIRG